MKLARHPQLDALCGEYLLGTMRRRPRHRFERALKEEPFVAARLAHWQRTYAPRPSDTMRVRPDPETWRRLETELGLARYRQPWWRRGGLWRAWATVATAALIVVAGVEFQRWEQPRELTQVAQLGSKEQPGSVVASVSSDRTYLQLRAARPIQAGPAQSYELWLIPKEGGAPLSLAVLGSLDAKLVVPEGHRKRLQDGATLAGVEFQRWEQPRELTQVAQLGSKEQPGSVVASVSSDRTYLQLRAARPIQAGPAQSYELWLIPKEGGAPLSLAVLGSLDAKLVVPEGHRKRLQDGATLAVSVEPAGGSPTGAPTGPVIMTGVVKT